jgi:hypothetical protein
MLLTALGGDPLAEHQQNGRVGLANVQLGYT